MRLPAHVLDTIHRVVAQYPGPASEERIAKVLNEIAWAHREDPIRNANGEVIGHLEFGLSEKTSGKHVRHPILGGIAEDILQLPDGTHWDIFGGIDIGQPFRPPASPPESIVPNTPRKWLRPVDPEGEVIIPAPPPPPPPDAQPPIAPPPTVVGCRAECGAIKADIQAVYELIAAKVIDEHIGELYKRIAVLDEKLDQLLAKDDPCRFPKW